MHKNKQPKKVVASKQVTAKPFDKVLIDDVVQHIFSYLPVRARAKFGEVSSQWKKISRRPSLWLAVEMAFISRADRNVKRKKDINSTRHLISLAAFLHKYCTSLEDLHLSYDHHPDMTPDRLDAFFQIKSLKRMRILELSPHDRKHEYLPSTIPACTNLELLNFDPYISVEATKKLFQGLKSLKELYVPYAQIDFFNHKDVFTLATKLERLALKYYSMPAELLVKTCPSLRYITYYRNLYGKDSDSEDDGFKPIEVVGNTVAVRPEGFDSETFRENYKLLEPILVPYLGNYESLPFLAVLASDYYHNKEIIKYLVQEKKYDLHYECPQYTYRQSFQRHFASFSSSKLASKFTLAAAIKGYWRDVESVQELIELGCSAECPKEGHSYLTHAQRADVRLLLLRLGADPNKIVDVDIEDRKYYFDLTWMRGNMLRAPAFAFHFMDRQFDDSEEFVLALKGRVDFNTEVEGETMLGINAVNNKTRCMDRNKQAQKKYNAGASKLSTRQASQSQSQSDLNNDVLRHIFSFLPPRTRGKIGEVSKKWCHASRDPILWPVMEIMFKQTRKGSVDYDLRPMLSLVAFLQKYCTNLVDLNLCFDEATARSHEILHEVFQIKSLRRLKVKAGIQHGGKHEFLLSKKPACHGLELLNLDLQTTTNYVSKIISSLPNLKELYLPHIYYTEDFSSPKLERLAVQSLGNVAAKKLVAANPSLKYLIIYSNPIDSEYQSITKVGKALVVRAEALQLHNIKRNYKELAPLIMPYMASDSQRALLPLLSVDYPSNKEVIKYLVQERGFDLNYTGSEYTYRPSFQRYDRHDESADPIAAVCKTYSRPLEPVQELLSLGANAECPDNEVSYLNTSNAAVRVLLLKHGANPNKAVKIKMRSKQNAITHVAVPVYAVHFMSSAFEDSEEFVLMLKDKVDLNAVVQSKSLLQWAIELKKWASVSALISLGVKCNEASLTALLKGDKKRFQQLLVNKTIDVNELSARVVIDAVHENMTPYLAEYLKVHIDKKNEYGYTLLHLLATSWPGNSLTKEYKNNPHKSSDRWIVSGPVTLTTEAPRQKLRFKDDVEALNYTVGRDDGDDEEENSDRPSLTALSSMLHEQYFALQKEIDPNFDGRMFVPVNETKIKKQSTSKDDSDDMSDSDEGEHFNSVRVRSQPKTQALAPKPQLAAKSQGKGSTANPDLDWTQLFKSCQPAVNAQSNDGETALLLACKSHISDELKSAFGVTESIKFKRVEELLANGADANIADNQGWTPLHAACYSQAWNVALALIKAKAKVNAQDQNGITPIMAAVYGWHHVPQKGSELVPDNFGAALLVLLAAMKDVDFSLTEKHTNRTFLHMISTIDFSAATFGKILGLLRSQNREPRDVDGFTPLHYATMYGANNVIKKLVEFGCDINCRTTAMRITPAMIYLTIASDFEPLKPYKFCLENCVTNFLSNRQYKDIKIAEKNQLSMVIEAPWNFKGEISADHSTNHGYTTLTYVPDTLAFFLKNSDLTLVDSWENNYLHYLVIFYSKLPEEVPVCCEQYPVLSTLWNQNNSFQIPPFYLWARAIRYPTYEGIKIVIDIIMKLDIDISEIYGDGHSILEWISTSTLFHCNPEAWSKLGAKLDFTKKVRDIDDKNMFTTMMIDQNPITTKILKFIAKRNPQILLTQRDSRGRNLLIDELEECFKSGEFGAEDSLSILMKMKELINQQDNNGDTALHIACRFFTLGFIDSINGHRESFSKSHEYCNLVFMLLDAGADPTIKNNRGETPLSYVPRLKEFEVLYKKWFMELRKKARDELRERMEQLLARAQPLAKKSAGYNRTPSMHKNKQVQKKYKLGTVPSSGQVTQSQDLNHDVLRHIFSFLPPRTRGKIGEVSKKWCHASRDPFSWPVVEITFKPTKRDDSKYHLKRVRSLIAFLQKYCTNLVDLNLCCEVIVRSREILEEVFQIKSLRRLKIKVRIDYGQQPEFLPSKDPACLGLELLNLDLQTSTNYVRAILTSLPNLKEVYLPHFNKVFVFSSPKLERLGMQSLDNVSATRVVTANPSLKFLVISRSKVDSSDSDSDDEWGIADGGGVIQRVNNALIVRAEALQLHNIKRNYKELAPLIMPYMANDSQRALLSLLSLSYHINKEVIKYLVQEQGFDVNYTGSEYTYRPSFQNFDRFEAITTPIAAVLQSNPKKALEPVQELLSLGANAECPINDVSYLNTPSAAVRVLLLKHGANPNKIVNIRPPRPNTMFQIAMPVYVAHFVNSAFDDSEEFVLMLKDKVDLNAVVQSKSLLQWAIELKKWASVSALISLGVKCNQEDLSALLKGDKSLFQQLLVNKTIDVNQLSTSVVIDAIHENMTPYLTEYLKVNIDKKNEYGYTLLHLLATSWPRNNAKKEYKNNPHSPADRWIVSGPVAPTNEPTRQKLRFKDEMEAVNHAMGLDESDEEDSNRPPPEVLAASIMRNAVATTESPSKNAQFVPLRQLPIPQVEVGKKRKRDDSDNDSDHHESSSSNEELMEIASDISYNHDDESNDSASDNDDNDNFYGVPRSALTSFQQRPPPMIKAIECSSDSSSDSSEIEKPVNRGKKRPRESSSESENSVSDNEDNGLSIGGVPLSAIQSFRESLDDMVQEKKRKRVDSSSSSEDDEDKLSGIPRSVLESIRESLGDEPSSIPKHVDDEVMENMRRYQKEKNYFKEDSPTDDNGVPRDFVRQLIADNNTNRKKKVASDDEVSDDVEDRRFIHESDEVDAHDAAYLFGQKTQQKKSVAKSLFNGSDVDFDWTQLFKSCQPAVNTQSNDGETALLLACKSYISDDLKAENVRIQRVQELLANGADVNIADNQGWTPLHAACYARDRDVALALIKANANVNAQDQNGITPIMAAVYGWHHVPKKDFAYTELFGCDLLALLKEMKGVDFSLTEKHTNRTLLHMISTINFSAATFGEILDQLRLQNLEPRDIDGFTPLHYATMYGANNVIKKLVEFGCDINSQTTAMRITPAMIYLTIIASDFTPQKPYKICLEYCATNFLSNRQYKDIKLADNQMVIEAPWNFKGKISADHSTNHGYTTLTYVPDTLAFFLKNSDLTLVDSCGNNYLHYLVLLFALSPEEVLVCCKKYPTLNTLWNQKNSRNITPLHMWKDAIGEYPTDEAVKIIIDIITKLDIDITEIYGDGHSIFSWICTTTHFHCKPEEWSELGAKIDFTKKSVDFSDKNALTTMMAERTVPSEIISFISKRNPQLLVTQKDRHGRTLLIQEIEETAKDGEFQTEGALFDLLKMKDLINQQDNNGDTALHIACKYFTLGFIDSINGHKASFWTSFGYNYFAFLLLDAGADPTIKNNRGETPLTYVPQLLEYYEELYKKWLKEVIERENEELHEWIANSGRKQPST